MIILKCLKCGVKLTDENWYKASKKHGTKLCKICERAYKNKWSHDNREKYRESAREYTYRNGVKPMSENKECSQYLGCHIAERVLSKVFEDIKVMPTHNHGYDFICNKGKKIDVKSSCARKKNSGVLGWSFDIKRNTIPDYFLCIAFDDRDNLNPLHLWLLPADKCNHLSATTIRESTLYKWDTYKLDVSKVVECCEEIRSVNNENE